MVIKPLLSKTHIEKRLSWAQKTINRDWSNVIFLDESTFLLFNPLWRVWLRKEQTFIQRSIRHPQKMDIYGCFSAHGFGGFNCFTENLNAVRIIKLHKKKDLVKPAEMLYGKNNHDCILQVDNHPKHKSRLCTQRKL